VIPTYNGERFLQGVLQSVFSQKNVPPFEVLVIDSSSQDRTGQIVQSFQAQLKVIPKTEFSHPETRNLGVSMSQGRYVVFLTQDATPAHSGWLSHLIEPFQKLAQVAAVYSRQIPRPQWCDGWEEFLITQGAPLTREVRRLDLSNQVQAEQYHRNPWRYSRFSNVSAAYRRDLLIREPFDRRLPMMEDAEWSQRILEKGWGIVYEPTSLVIHSNHFSGNALYRRYWDFGFSSQRFVKFPLKGRHVLGWGAMKIAKGLIWALRSFSLPKACQILIREALAKTAFYRGWLSSEQRYGPVFRRGSEPLHLRDMNFETQESKGFRKANSECMPEVSIIILTKNEGKYLGEGLGGLMEQRGRTSEILIIDSGSTDNTLEVARRFPVKIFEIDSYTPGRALNFGARLAQSPVVVNLSAHAFPRDDRWLDHLTGPVFEVRAEATFGMQVPIPGSNPFEEVAMEREFPADGSLSLTRVPFSNVNCAIRKSTLLERPFIENILFSEDYAWYLKNRDGVRIEYVALAAVTHSHPLQWRRVWQRVTDDVQAKTILHEQFSLAMLPSQGWRRGLIIFIVQGLVLTHKLWKRRAFRGLFYVPLYLAIHYIALKRNRMISPRPLAMEIQSGIPGTKG